MTNASRSAAVNQPHSSGPNIRRASKNSRSGKRVWLMRGMTLVVTSLVALFIAEIALRVFVLQEGKRLAIYDRLLGWRGRPQGKGIYARKSDHITASFTYNELGYRDQSVPPKQEGELRLMLLGDSFVESLEVEYAQTFGALLEQKLRNRDSRWDVSVIGSQGYSTAQELLAFVKYQAIIQSDIVVLCFYCGNDFEDNQRHRFAYLDEEGQLVLPPASNNAWRNGLQSLQRWLYETSHVVYLLKNSLERMTNVHIAPTTKTQVAAGDGYQRDITAQLIQRLQHEVQAADAILAIAIIPARDELKAGNDDKPQFVAEVCSRLKIPYVDLTPHLEPADYFDIDLHFNPQGHQVAARAMDAFISTELSPPEKQTLSSADHGQSFQEE